MGTIMINCETLEYPGFTQTHTNNSREIIIISLVGVITDGYEREQPHNDQISVW